MVITGWHIFYLFGVSFVSCMLAAHVMWVRGYRPKDLRRPYDQGIAEGRELERSDTLKWLRQEARTMQEMHDHSDLHLSDISSGAFSYSEVADSLERGQHLPEYYALQSI